MRRNIKSMSPLVTPRSDIHARKSYDFLKNEKSSTNIILNTEKIEDFKKYQNRIDQLEKNEKALTEKMIKQSILIEHLSEKLRKYETFKRYYPENNEMIFEEEIENSPFINKPSPIIFNNSLAKTKEKKKRLSNSSKRKEIFNEEEQDPRSPKDSIKEGKVKSPIESSDSKKSFITLKNAKYSNFLGDLVFSEEATSEVLNVVKKLTDFLKEIREELNPAIYESLKFSIELINSKLQLHNTYITLIFNNQSNIISQLNQEIINLKQRKIETPSPFLDIGSTMDLFNMERIPQIQPYFSKKINDEEYEFQEQVIEQKIKKSALSNLSLTSENFENISVNLINLILN